MGIVLILIFFLFKVMLFICHDWLGFSVLTTIFLTLSIVSIFFSYIEIENSKKSKDTLKKARKFTATVLSKEVVQGYHGRTSYTFE